MRKPTIKASFKTMIESVRAFDAATDDEHVASSLDKSALLDIEYSIEKLQKIAQVLENGISNEGEGL